MILGIGNDLIDMRRIERLLERFGKRFIERIFTDLEHTKGQKYLSISRSSWVAHYAKRFAAKEACVKALGTGFRYPISWQDIEVVSLSSGQPTLNVIGGAGVRLKHMTPSNMTAQIHLSLTDDYPFAQAIVIISAIHNMDAP